MSTELKLYINNDAVDSPLGSSGVEWIEVDETNDYFLFLDGSVSVADGEAIPSEAEMNRAATELTGLADIIVDKYFLVDDSVSLLKEIKNAGNQDKQYIFAVDFDGATASEPQLEAWDDNNMNSFNSEALGTGSPASGWYRAISTTGASSGSDWVGTRLGGDNSSFVVQLNDGNGALSVATTLYFNFKVVIPSAVTIPGTHTPILAITYTTN